MSLKTSLRTQGCGELRIEDVGKEVALCGWLQTRRDHGGVLFLDLRDRSGVAQVVVHPQKAEAFAAAAALRSEFVLRVTGKVAKRPAGTENPNMTTGLIEVPVEKLEVLNRCEPLPFEVSDLAGISEESRLKYRYLDLRRPRMLANLTLRHRAAQAARRFLDSQGFLEIETPILTKSTPEGARDFLVPARLSPGEFYALPQSPQIFKQILMVAGMERYFQLARAFRDEDLRADRQPEHTQIDVEMSFVSQEDVHAVAEGLMKAVFKETIGVEIETPFVSLEFSEAMLRYGSDKPDIRYGLELTDLTQTFQASEFKVFGETARGGGKVLALNAAGAGSVFSRGDLDKLVEFVKAAGAKGLPWIRFSEGKAESPIVKFLKDSELQELKAKLNVKDGDVVFFGVGEPYVAAGHLGALRKELIVRLGLKPSKPWAFLWVKHFPLLEWDKEENRWTFAHNPFTAPLASEIPMLDTDPGKMRSHQYDLVLNGVELASGSIRNNRPEIQQKIFALMGYEPAEQERRFGLLLNALRYGAPPHGGFGLGFDRLCAILRGEDSIREVIAFPKTAKGTDLMSECPSPANARQLKELHIQTTIKPANPDGKPVH